MLLYCVYTSSAVLDIASGCELDFNFYVDNGGTVEGVDFSMYKKSEVDVEGVAYFAFVFYQESLSLYVPVSDRVIDAECSSWQTFHLVDGFVQSLRPKQNHFKLVLAVFKVLDYAPPYTPMTCDEIKHTFFLDNKTVDFDFGMVDSSFPKRSVDTNELPTVSKLSTDMGADGQEVKATGSTAASPTELPTTADGEPTASMSSNDTKKPDSQDETTQPTSQEVTDNASVSKEITDASLPTLHPTKKPDSQDETIQPTSQEVTDNASVSKEITDASLSTLHPTKKPDIVEEIQATEMTFDPSRFLPMVTLFVVGERNHFTLPTTITPQTTTKSHTTSS